MEKQEFINKIQKVADLLGYKMNIPEESYQNQATLTHENKTIYIRNGGYKNENKIHIFGSYPYDCHNQHNIYSLKNPSINLSQDKTSEQIARDIQKRFMPDYLSDLEIVVARNNKTQQAADAKYSTIKKLADLLGIAPKKEDHNNEYTLPIWNILPGLDRLEVSYDGSEVDMKLVLTPDQTIQVLTILINPRKEVGDES